jgi:hypothetical protein
MNSKEAMIVSDESDTDQILLKPDSDSHMDSEPSNILNNYNIPTTKERADINRLILNYLESESMNTSNDINDRQAYRRCADKVFQVCSSIGELSPARNPTAVTNSQTLYRLFSTNHDESLQNNNKMSNKDVDTEE